MGDRCVECRGPGERYHPAMPALCPEHLRVWAAWHPAAITHIHYAIIDLPTWERFARALGWRS